jgi:FKBP-type peptidyl-prolyl cis-trans isomerase SlyD
MAHLPPPDVVTFLLLDSSEGTYPMQVTRGSVVSFNYTLTDDDGNILDSSENCDPLVYLHGYENIIPGLEDALEGTETGHKSQVVVDAGDAYGEVDQGAIFEVPRDQFPEDMPLEPGMQFMAETPSGDVALRVVGANETDVTVDGNHPLAGMRLHFDVEIIDVRAASEEELEQGYPQSGEE